MINYIDGKQTSNVIKQRIKDDLDNFSNHIPYEPHLTVILVGHNPSSEIYVRNKERACNEIGVAFELIRFEDSVSEKTLITTIRSLNNDDHVDAIMVQMPLPEHINCNNIINSIDPSKDADGFHPLNLGKLMVGDNTGPIPATPLGISLLFNCCNIDTQGKKVVIMGRSNIVGKPLANLLSNKEWNASVTLLHSKSKNWREECADADIIVAAIGKPYYLDLKSLHVKDGVYIIDVGTTMVNGKLCGDVDSRARNGRANINLTPVPGGVGPMTIAGLLQNVYTIFATRHGLL